MDKVTNSREKVFYEPPLENKKATSYPPPKVAGGIPAIASSIKHGFKEMGVVRTLKTLSRVNQQEGFDCPGCAWPDPDKERSKTEFCENGAKAVAEEATTKKVTAEFFSQWSIGKLSQQSDHWLGKQGRLIHPMYLAPNSSHYVPISWEDAWSLVKEEFGNLEDPNEVAFYTSGRTSNEAAFLYQLFARIWGTNNLPDCSNMCHESSGVGLKEVIGIGKGTVTLEDFLHAECIIVVGQNPGTNHPRMLSTLQQAVRNGSRIITINPLEEAGMMSFQHPQEPASFITKGTSLTELFLPVKINGDIALLKGIMKQILVIEEQQGNILDHDFIKNYTSGFESFQKDLQNTLWDEIVESSGIDREKIELAANIICKAKSVICCWAMGLTQHENAIGNIQEIVNLLLLGGNIGRKGAGVCPVRGHSNVQGDRTVGITSKPTESFLVSLEKTFKFSCSRKRGLDTVDTIRAMYNQNIKVFIGMGGNFLSATPDTKYTGESLQKCRLTVQVSTKLNRSHLVTGEKALILPCLARTDEDIQNGKKQFVTVENSMGIVHSSIGSLKPASPNLKSEVAIVIDMLTHVLPAHKNKALTNWEQMKNYDIIRDYIEKIVPGFAGYNTKVRSKDGFYLPNPVRDARKFLTDTTKANFTIHNIAKNNLTEKHYMMMTIRSHDQYNTTIYGLNDRYRGIVNGRRIILMNFEDMKQESLQKNDYVTITSYFKKEVRTAEKFLVVPYKIPRQCVATYFPEANVLVHINNTAQKSNTPVSKSVIVTLSKYSGE